jgi:hypothetical protein
MRKYSSLFNFFKVKIGADCARKIIYQVFCDDQDKYYTNYEKRVKVVINDIGTFYPDIYVIYPNDICNFFDTKKHVFRHKVDDKIYETCLHISYSMASGENEIDYDEDMGFEIFVNYYCGNDLWKEAIYIDDYTSDEYSSDDYISDDNISLDEEDIY